MFSISSLVSLTKVTQIATDCKGQLNYEQFWSWKSKNKTKQKNGQMFWLGTFLRHFSAVQLMSLTIHCCIWTRLIVVQCSLTCDSVSSCKKWEATSCTGSSTLCAQWLGKWVFWSYHHFHAYFSAPCPVKIEHLLDITWCVLVQWWRVWPMENNTLFHGVSNY